MARQNRLLQSILAVDAVVVLLHVANGLTGLDKRLFDLDLEQNLPTWVSAVQFFGVALCAGLLSGYTRGRQRLAWRAFAGIFLFFSLDEVALLHEELVDRVATSPKGDAWFWPLFYLPLGIAALVAVAIVVGEVRRVGASATTVVAGLMLLGAALLLDGIAVALTDTPWLFEPAIVLEEASELVGTAVLVGVLAGMLAVRWAPPPTGNASVTFGR